MKKLIYAAVVLAMVLCAANAYAHKEAREMKKGILLVAFGTSEASAKVSFQHIEAKVKKAFPGVDVRWAYTSHIIRHKLAGQGDIILSPAQALAKMMDEGYTHVAVQSLHTIPGEEYHELAMTVNGFKAMPGGFDRLILGFPMLGAQDTVAKAVDAIFATLPKARKANDAVVLMGHGTHHPGNIYYSAMNWQLQPRTQIIMMTGYADITTAIQSIKQGAFNYISKPFLPEELLATIHEALEYANRTSCMSPNENNEEGSDYLEGTGISSKRLKKTHQTSCPHPHVCIDYRRKRYRERTYCTINPRSKPPKQ